MESFDRQVLNAVTPEVQWKKNISAETHKMQH